jgi:hypothetical protein
MSADHALEPSPLPTVPGLLVDLLDEGAFATRSVMHITPTLYADQELFMQALEEHLTRLREAYGLQYLRAKQPEVGFEKLWTGLFEKHTEDAEFLNTLVPRTSEGDHASGQA